MEGETKLEPADNATVVTEATEKENKSLKNDTVQTSQTGDTEDIKKKATLLYLQGKRAIYIRDYVGALAALSESCLLFSQIYPEMSDELADPYFYYGKALLEVGRSESEVLGDQVQDEEEDDDDDDDDEEEVAEENADGNKDGNTENGMSSNGDKVESAEHYKNKEGTEEGKGDAENTNNELNGEVNDLQLSWEYLELAKLIYLKKSEDSKEIAIKLAETYLCLGENGLESENYSVAIEDINKALELQKKHLKEEDRRIAETYYQLGVAHSLSQNYDEAIESFKKAIEQLEKKIASLELRKKIGDKKTEEEEKDAFYTMDGEMNEIRTVIKDVEEKIKDMMDSKNKVKAELIKQVCGEGQSSSSSSAEAPRATSSSVPTTDISHLIKRKRKNEEDESSQEKKSKTE